MKNLFGIMILAMVLLQSCGDDRGPLSTEKAGDFKLTLISDKSSGKARIDTFHLVYSLTDGGNVISENITRVQFRSKFGIIDTTRGVGFEDGAKPLVAKYVYPNEISDTLYDTVVAFYPVPLSKDTVKDTAFIRIDPLLEGSGYLPPAILNLEVGTDTVYKVGAGWKMFVFAKVSDSLGNPVRDGIAVNFSYDSSTVDTNLVSLVNVTQTGQKQCIESVCDSLPGQAISLLSFSSQAISDTLKLLAALEGKKSISSIDTLIIPLPKQGLLLEAHYRNAGDLIVDHGPDTAKIEVTLKDAYKVPVPGKTVCVNPRGGYGVPSCYVRDENDVPIGSTPCGCKEDDESCDLLPKPFCGLTDEEGSFMYKIVVEPRFQLDPEVPKQTVQVELEEQETHVQNLEFNFDVLFPAF